MEQTFSSAIPFPRCHCLAWDAIVLVRVPVMERSQVVVAVKMWRISQVVVPVDGRIRSSSSRKYHKLGSLSWRDHKLW